MTCFSHNPHARDPRIRWDRLAVWGVYLLLLGAVAAGCVACVRQAAAAAGHRAVEALPAVAPLPAPTSTKDADQQLAEARNRADRAEQDRAAAKADIVRLEHERDQLAQRDLQRRLSWVRGIALIAVLACIGLWFVLPAGIKSWAVYAGLGCLGIAAAALVLRALVPYLEWIGWGMVAAGAAFGLWKLYRFKAAAIQAAAHGDRLEATLRAATDWIEPATFEHLVAEVKTESAKLQTKAGLHGVIEALRGKKPKPATPPAPGGAA